MLRSLIASCAAAGALLCTASAAQASLIVYTATLSGAAESPPQASAGTGFASVAIDDVANTMNIHVDFSGLTGTTLASHIHCCTAVPGAGNVGVATETPTFSLFPLGVQSGTFFESYDLTQASTYNPPFLTANGGTAAGAQAALLAGLATQRAYLNIHTTFAQGGEIRGFLAVPEPEAWALMILGFGAVGATLRRRRVAMAVA
jgi:hypothetical protein